MLSAVAARKSRLQQQNASGTASPVSRPSSPPLTPSPKDAVAAKKPHSKRKASSSTQPAPRRKKNKSLRATSPTANDSRYFQSVGKEGAAPDLIVIDDEYSDAEDDATVSDDDSSTGSASPPPRPWSHSAAQTPARVNEDVAMDDDYFTTPARRMRPFAPADVSSLSTFSPEKGTNTFPLSSDEFRELGAAVSDYERNSCVVLLSPSERLALFGTYRLQVLRGAVSLAGVTLKASSGSYPVFASRGGALPIIEALGDHHDRKTSLPSRVQSVLKEDTVVILLQEMPTGIEGLGKVCKTFEDAFNLSRSRSEPAESSLGLRGVTVVTYPPSGVYSFTLPDSWEAGLSTTVPTPAPEIDYSRKAFFVKGAKKSGKSTFARTLLNRLSTRYRYVAFLECDLGQSEFTPGGMVALNVISSPVFGPPFSHPSVPYQSHYIGSTTPASSPSRYLAAIQAVIHTYNTDLQHASLTPSEESSDDDRIDDFIPLVVNMMGWSKGLGADMSDRIEDMLHPSAVFEFEAPVYDDGWATPAPYRSDGPSSYEPSSSTPPSYPVHRLPPISLSSGSKYTAADLRQLSILSYFHAVFPTSPSPNQDPIGLYAQFWDTSLPLCAQIPYEISCDTALDIVVLAGPGSEDVVPSEVLRVLNGAVVALVSHEPGTLEVEPDPTTSSSGIPYSQGAHPPSPTSSICHGLALILLMKTPPRVLVKGDMELPVWGMLDFRSETHVAGVAKADVPYLRWGGTSDAAVGANKRRTRRNLMRKGQM
ncbi:Polynucleotide 5'-hydroxyl-kinase grc3 [Steccherinum ochraceum]|uniref:Polynucleotide 5'-hydroxyl-kinase GRC3 n=1 Tax=Steccherinum ochraceum TaxID=92696 RepID=A0A4R0RDF8_9APHY|nr:Polynucleotide 5'-hydroxyl-kinase grc3 [Steccherinum ochraceum]